MVVAAGWTRNLYLGRTYSWSKDYETKLKAATLAQVNAAFRKYIDPAKLSVVTAGDQPLVEQVEHLQERHVLAHAGDVVLHHGAGGRRAGLAPDAQRDVLEMVAHL